MMPRQILKFQKKFVKMQVIEIMMKKKLSNISEYLFLFLISFIYFLIKSDVNYND